MGRSNPVRAVTNLFRRRRDGGGGGTEVLEQVQKIEVVLREPNPDADKLRLRELTNMIIPHELSKPIPKNFDTIDLYYHFRLKELEGRWD